MICRSEKEAASGLTSNRNSGKWVFQIWLLKEKQKSSFWQKLPCWHQPQVHTHFPIHIYKWLLQPSTLTTIFLELETLELWLLFLFPLTPSLTINNKLEISVLLDPLKTIGLAHSKVNKALTMVSWGIQGLLQAIPFTVGPWASHSPGVCMGMKNNRFDEFPDSGTTISQVMLEMQRK